MVVSEGLVAVAISSAKTAVKFALCIDSFFYMFDLSIVCNAVL